MVARDPAATLPVFPDRPGQMTTTTSGGPDADSHAVNPALEDRSALDHQDLLQVGPDRPDDSVAEGRRSLTIALVLIVGYMILEVTAGYLSGSLILLAHAGHMLADAVSIGLALVAMRASAQYATAERTYGFHRTEVLASLINALTLWGISVAVLLEAYRRLSEAPEVQGGLMLIVGSIGLVVNISALWMMHGSA